MSDAALERTRERLAEAAATRVDTIADAGVDGYARDDEGERDDGVRADVRRSRFDRIPPNDAPRIATSSVGSRPDAARAGSPHPARASRTRGDSPFPCEIAHEARISSTTLGVGTKGVGPERRRTPRDGGRDADRIR